MKKIISALLFALMASTHVFADTAMNQPAQEQGKKLTKQQMKMKKCSKGAKEKKLKGEERRKFMKSCLSGKS